MADTVYSVKAEFILENKGTRELANITTGMNNLEKQSKSFGSTISNSVGNAFSGLSSKISSSLSSVRTSLASFSSSIQTSLSGIVKVGQQVYKEIGFIGTALVGIFTNKLKNAIKDATSVFLTFDDQMRKVAAVTESTGATFDSLTAKAREMGATTSFTAQEAAQAMTLLGQAGFDANEIMSSLPATLNLARASMTDLTTTADIMSTIMNGFQIDAEDTARVSDVLSKAANATNTDVTGLGQAMKYVAPLAHQMGWSLEETASAAGLLSNAGIKSSMAGTVLRNAISRLLSPTQKATDILASYGISLDSISPKTHNFAQIVDILTKAGVSAGDMMQIFGMRAGPGMLAMVNIGTGAINSMNQALYDSAGYAQEAADKMDAGWGGVVRRLNDAVESFKLTFGKAFADILTPFAQAVSVIGVAISKLPAPVIYLASAFALAAVVAGTLLTALASLHFIVPVLSAGMNVLTMGIVKTAMGLTSLSYSGGILGSTLGLVARSLLSVVSLVSPHIKLILALAAAFYFLEEKTQIFSKTWETLQDLWTIGVHYLKKAFEELKKVVSKAIDDIITDLKKLANDTGLTKFVDVVTDAYDKVSKYIGNWRSEVHENAEAIRSEEEKQGQSAQNVQKQIENSHDGIISSYQTVDSETGVAYADMIENSSEYADSITGANDEIISSNNDLISSNGDVASSFAFKAEDTDISSVVSQNYGMEDFNNGIELADGGFIKLNEHGQLIYQTVDGISKILADMPSMSLETADGGTIQTNTDVPANERSGRTIHVGKEGQEQNAADEAYMESPEYTASLWAKDHPDYTYVDLEKYPGFSEEQIKRIESGEWDKPIVFPDYTQSTEGMSDYERNVLIARENNLTPEQTGTIPDSFKTGIVDPEAYADAIARQAQEDKDELFQKNVGNKFSSFIKNTGTSLTDDAGWSGFFKYLLKGDIGTVLGGESTDIISPAKKIWNTQGIGKPLQSTEGMASASFDPSGILDAYDKVKSKMGEIDSFNFSGLRGNLSNVKGGIDEQTTASDVWKSVMSSLDSINLTSLNSQISSVGNEEVVAGEKADEHKFKVEALVGTDLSTLWSNIASIGAEQDTAALKGTEHKGVLDTLKGTTLGELVSQIFNVGTEEDTTKQKGVDLQGQVSTLDTITLPNIKSEIASVGATILNDITTSSIFQSAVTMWNSISFSGLLSSISSVGSAINGLITSAKSMYSQVMEYVSNAKSAISGSSSSSKMNTSGVSRSGGSGTGEQNVKINQINNYGTSLSKTKLKKAGI